MNMVAVYAGTRNLYEMMRVSVTSLLANNKMDRVYLLIEDDVFPHKMPENVIAVNVSNQTYFPEGGANYKCKWTYMSMIRVALSKMFPHEDHVLWLDCDTIIDADISELFEMNMDGYYVAGVREHRKEGGWRNYINTGVLMMNLDKIRRYGIDEQLIDLLNHKKLECPDQDAINTIAQGRILFLPSDYNICPFTEPPYRSKIYHFAARERFDNDPMYRKYSGKHVPTRTLIAIPCFDMVYTDFMACMLNLQYVGETSHAEIKNSLIYEARNNIAQNAIRSGFDRVLWLDSDVIFKPDTLVKLSEDMDTGLDFVSGLYFRRAIPTQPVVYSEITYEVKDNEAKVGSKIFTNYPKNQLFRCAGAGFGCVMTSTLMLKALVEKYGAPFTPLMGLGEDLAFCFRAEQNGFKLYCDSRVKCGHKAGITIDESYM